MRPRRPEAEGAGGAFDDLTHHDESL